MKEYLGLVIVQARVTDLLLAPNRIEALKFNDDNKKDSVTDDIVTTAPDIFVPEKPKTEADLLGNWACSR